MATIEGRITALSRKDVVYKVETDQNSYNARALVTVAMYDGTAQPAIALYEGNRFLTINQRLATRILPLLEGWAKIENIPQAANTEANA